MRGSFVLGPYLYRVRIGSGNTHEGTSSRRLSEPE